MTKLEVWIFPKHYKHIQMNSVYTYFFAFLFFLLAGSQLNAQTTGLRIPYFTDYHLNPIYYNPAFTGEEGQAKMGLSGRSIKSGASEPVSFQGFIQGQVEAIESGLGLMVNYHSFGDEFKRRQLKIGLLYSYTIQAGDKGRFKLGLNSSLLHYNSNFVPSGSGSVDVIKSNESFFKFNMDGSILFLSGDFYMGVTMFHVNEPRFEFYNIGSSNRFQKETYISLGQAIRLNENISLHPAAMINFTLNQFSTSFNNQGYIDVSVLARFHDRYMAGVTYKMNQTPYNFAVMAGVKLAEKYQIAATFHLKESSNFTNRSRVGLTLNYFLPQMDEEDTTY